MSETQIKQEVQIYPAKAPAVKRNGIEVVLEEQVFGKLHKSVGRKFWAPKLDVSNKDHVTWVVAENLNGIINKELRSIFGDIYLDCFERNTDTNTGKLNHASFLEDLNGEWVEFTAGRAKLADLQEQIDILQDQITPLVTDPQFQVEDPTDPTTFTPEYVALANKVTALNRRIIPLRKQHAALKEEGARRAALRKANEEKSATKTPAPATVGV